MNHLGVRNSVNTTQKGQYFTYGFMGLPQPPPELTRPSASCRRANDTDNEWMYSTDLGTHSDIAIIELAITNRLDVSQNKVLTYPT
jgi:hypothetical protein